MSNGGLREGDPVRTVRARDWVEIVRTVFEPAERLAATPEDTRSMPYEARIRGHACRDGAIGDEMTIETRIGRTLSGTLVDAAPGFSHGFGQSIPELLWIGPDVRRRIFPTERVEESVVQHED